MKIKKFNEAQEPIKKYHVCMVINSESTSDFSGIFNTEEDMDNWLLNTVNKMLLDIWDGDNDEKPNLFTDVINAINWIQEENNCNVYYDDDVIFYNNVKLKYNVDVLRNTKKFNI